jgi:putative membrane protein
MMARSRCAGSSARFLLWIPLDPPHAGLRGIHDEEKPMKTMISVLAASLLMSVSAFAAPSTTDTDFATKAAEAGLAEVAAGHAAEAKGQSAGVKAFGKRMVADHTKAGDELKDVAAKSGVKLPTTMSAEQKAAGEKLAKLTGAAFDTAYSEQAVKDHEEAVALFQKEASAGSDAGLKMFAQMTLPTLQEHLKMAKALPAGAGAMSKGQ